jgi:hypothetical protein
MRIQSFFYLHNIVIFSSKTSRTYIGEILTAHIPVIAVQYLVLEEVRLPRIQLQTQFIKFKQNSTWVWNSIPW